MGLPAGPPPAWQVGKAVVCRMPPFDFTSTEQIRVRRWDAKRGVTTLKLEIKRYSRAQGISVPGSKNHDFVP